MESRKAGCEEGYVLSDWATDPISGLRTRTQIPWAEADQRLNVVDSVVAVDRVMAWKGSHDSPVLLESVEAWIAETSKMYGRCPMVFDPWQGQGSAQRLRTQNVQTVEFQLSATVNNRIAVHSHDGAKEWIVAVAG